VALEQRLRAEALTSGIPLNRLRKESAFNRLLARLSHAAPDVWALKGGLALIARVGAQVRGTKDADTNWRATRQDLEDVLFEIEDLDLQDWFRFSIGDARPLQGEGEAGALRYSVTVNLAGRVFEQLQPRHQRHQPRRPAPHRTGQSPTQSVRLHRRTTTRNPHGDTSATASGETPRLHPLVLR
jgi:hypothetical protein